MSYLTQNAKFAHKISKYILYWKRETENLCKYRPLSKNSNTLKSKEIQANSKL